MGTFDSVWVNCPKCGKVIEFQSKAGACVMEGYTLDSAPPALLGDLKDAQMVCKNCGWTVVIRVSINAYLEMTS